MYYTDILFISILIVLLVVMVWIDGDSGFWIMFGLFWGVMLVYGYFIFRDMGKEGKEGKEKKKKVRKKQ